MKLCIIGNSHTACLKQAWDELGDAEKGNFELTFFAIPRDFVKQLRAENGSLTMRFDNLKPYLERSSGGESHIDPDQYDAFLLYGLNWSKQFGHSFSELVANDSQFYSAAIKEAVREDFWQHNPLKKVIRQLRKVTDKPCYVAHTPLDAAPQKTKGPNKVYKDFVSFCGEDVLKQFNISFIQQPENTIVNGFYTDEKYTAGSVRLNNEPHPVRDRVHMNADFGKQVLEDLFNMMGE